ncbi:unnamed protein product, partial [Urochloa humidicola]
VRALQSVQSLVRAHPVILLRRRRRRLPAASGGRSGRSVHPGGHHLPSPALSPSSGSGRFWPDGGGPPRLPRNDSEGGARRGGPAGSWGSLASPGTSQRPEARRGPASLGSRPSGSRWRAAGAGGCGGRTFLPRVEGACGRRASRTGRIRGGRTYLPRIEAARRDPVGACGWARRCPEGAHGGEIRRSCAGVSEIGGKKVGVAVSREPLSIPGFDELVLAGRSHPAASHRHSPPRRAAPLLVIRWAASFARAPPPCRLCATLHHFDWFSAYAIHFSLEDTSAGLE